MSETKRDAQDDPGTGVSQAGWEVEGRRHGAFARGVTVAGDGGRVGVSPGGWLVLYEWSAARRSLRQATLMPGGEVRYAVDGVAAPFDDAAARWLAATVRGYGATARRYRPSSHPAVAAPAAR